MKTLRCQSSILLDLEMPHRPGHSPLLSWVQPRSRPLPDRSSRWPVWVGGRRAEQQTWRWSGFADLEVPSFLWAPDEPRTYSRDLMPEGVCMILDGYRRFHGASLPCHLRRSHRSPNW
ncbi:hypothetical protein E2C01_001423 [Portunus trituberculatus]|uniref:Uncharacterized protein n=1 Tax=Portunus trituberculatus TaxID=210409 RepID=A0A5B7CHY2_PORTR|nr:hypothetical protein [Portunus trituberculatus]